MEKSLEVVAVVLVQCNLVDNYYHRKPYILLHPINLMVICWTLNQTI